MINFENGVTPINDTNLNQMQLDLQLDTGISSSNIDEINKTEFRYTSDIERTPNRANGYLFTHRMDNDYILQEFTSFNANDKWLRAKTNGVWRDWKSLYDQPSTVELTLLNSWTFHTFPPQIVKKSHMLFISFAIEGGTGTIIAKLPLGFRPLNSMFVPASKYGGNGTVVKISSDGNIMCEQADVGQLLTVNAVLLGE